jgi:imidazoleglycerol-phosphate dehydratase/histidinol-phosphatase
MRKLLFLDRDGTLIAEPPDRQVDHLDKLKLLPDVVHALKRLQDAGYGLVMVSNQDGLGTVAYPQAAFDAVQGFLLELLDTQGIRFEAVRICPHLDSVGCECRKPRVGLLLDYLKDLDWDRVASAMVGDRDTDLKLAENLGVRGFKLAGIEGDGLGWTQLAAELLDAPRRATVTRKTRETGISASVDLDAVAPIHVETGIGFFDHMLEQVAKHGGFALQLSCTGDLHIDEHHTVEDCALVLGEALRKALGDLRGVQRFGFVLPMDEARAEVLLDLSGRPFFKFEGAFPRSDVGGLPTELVPHFFRSLSSTLGATLHIRVEGENAHHMVESAFKGTALALRQACRRGTGLDVPSTKGLL